MKAYLAYIRVSTVKQGEHGSSLQEQRDAILAFAARNQLNIIRWYEERETAAKTGRREFTRMLTVLKKHQAAGVIFHKIDRSARNLRDWSAIQDLADLGVDVRFAHESVNLGSNEGKLTGDFLAVISAHYIRNLRDEVKKGIQGRLKQGLYPLAAPLGYLDQGGGKPKIPDPMRAPFVREAFELYARGFALPALSDELYRRGLRSKIGKKVGINRLSEMLRNPFYMGIIRMKRSGQHYAGVHEPIVSKRLFERVEAALDGKANTKAIKHDFLYRRQIECKHCRYHLIGEKVRGHIYYRCHTMTCPKCSVKEETIDAAVSATLCPLALSKEDRAEFARLNATLEGEWAREKAGFEQALALQTEAINSRLASLMDAYLDGVFDRTLFEEKKRGLLMQRQELEERKAALKGDALPPAQRVAEYLELVDALPLSYGLATLLEKRELLKTLTSNLSAEGKNVVVELKSPFREIAELDLVPTGAPVRGIPRTRAMKIFKLLINYFTAQNEEIQRREKSLPAAA